MSARTGIEWTDVTWNAITGCEQVSPGCARCYAKVEHDRRHTAYLAGKKVAPQYAQPFEVVQLHPDRLDAPLRHRQPSRYFVTSGADPFHEDVPDEFLDRLFAIMAMAPRHVFQLLTKRPLRMLAYMTDALVADRVQAAAYRLGDEFRTTRRFVSGDSFTTWPLPNVWLGVSVENQRFADERIPLLLQSPAAVRFLSCEPLLGPVDLRNIGAGGRGDDCDALYGRRTRYGYKARTRDECSISVSNEPCERISWVIVGGESGAKARPFDLAWARRILVDCRAAGVPVFVKQLGALPGFKLEDEAARGNPMPGYHHFDAPSGLHIKKLRDRHGADMAEWPEDLRVREFPEVRPC